MINVAWRVGLSGCQCGPAGMVTGGSYAAPAMKDATGMGIRAYHGSPHDFDKFDLAKIGTGEGAQSYGHGLYFAENPATAQSYRDALSPSSGHGPVGTATRVLNHFGGDRKAAIAELNNRLADLRDPAGGRMYGSGLYSAQDTNTITQAKQILESGRHVGGRMYEVNINAEPHQFVNYDKRLGEQSPEVQAAIRRMAPDVTDAFHPAERVGPELAQQFTQQGIPGIKYLDQGSRPFGPMGNGNADYLKSHNYVVFNPDIIDILKKYGIALPGAAAATQMMDANQPAPMAGF